MGTPTTTEHNLFTLTCLSCAPGGRGSNLGSLDLESDALPTELPLTHATARKDTNAVQLDTGIKPVSYKEQKFWPVATGHSSYG